MATWTNNSKNNSTFQNVIRHGTSTLLSDLQNFTFLDAPFLNDSRLLKDLTFNDFVSQSWVNQSKNVPVFTNITKN